MGREGGKPSGPSSDVCPAEDNGGDDEESPSEDGLGGSSNGSGQGIAAFCIQGSSDGSGQESGESEGGMSEVDEIETPELECVICKDSSGGV